MAEDKQKFSSNLEPKGAWWQPAVMMFIRFSSWIFAPVIIAIFIGKWLDNKYQTAPWLFLATVGFAFLISIFGLIKTVKEEYSKIEKAGNNQEAKHKEINNNQ